MNSRPMIIAVAVLLGVSLVGVIVWRSIPRLPQVDAPKILELDDTITTGEPEWHDDSERVILRRFAEPPLDDESLPEGTTYRLILLPTFDRPILVQAHLDAAGPYLKTKTLNGEGGFGLEELGILALNEERQISRTEWERLKELVEIAEFWASPKLDRNEVPVTDGASWSFYGRDFKLFHRIHRITPNQKTLNMFRYLLKLSGHEKDYDGYWPPDTGNE